MKGGDIMPASVGQKTACLEKATQIAIAAAGSGGNGNMSDELLAKIIDTTYRKMVAITEEINK